MTTLYVIDDRDGNLKVGITNNLRRRLKTFKTANPDKLRIWLTKRYATRRKARKNEKALHGELLAWKRPGGSEWFENTLTTRSIIRYYLSPWYRWRLRLLCVGAVIAVGVWIYIRKTS